MKKAGLKGIVKFSTVDLNAIGIDDILAIHKYIMKGKWYKIMFELIKNIFIELLRSLGSVSIHTSFVSLTNQSCINQPTRINWHPNEYCQELHYYQFVIR